MRQELDGQSLEAADVGWGPIALSNVTPFLAVRTKVGRCERTAVVKATLSGDVAGRRHDALREVLTNRTDVLRYLISLLGDPAYATLLGQGTGENGGFQPDPAYAIDLALFEPLVRAVARDDDSLERITNLIRDRSTTTGRHGSSSLMRWAWARPWSRAGSSPPRSITCGSARNASTLVRDYERLPEHHEAMVLWSTVTIMTRQLARHTTGTPPQPRWGGDRPAPPPSQISRPPETFANRL